MYRGNIITIAHTLGSVVFDVRLQLNGLTDTVWTMFDYSSMAMCTENRR